MTSARSKGGDKSGGKAGRAASGTGGGASARGGARGTLVERLVQSLADDIVEGRLAPGVRLEELDLAARFRVSRTPVREALRLLAATGLVEVRPNRGTIVASISEARLRELFEVMAELEGVCARLAAGRMSPGERRELEALHLDMAALVRSGDRASYDSVNAHFHAALYRGAHNRALEETVLAARRRVAAFRRAQFNVLGRLQQSWAEHDQVVRAILCGDGEAAARAIRAHVQIVRAASVEFYARAVPDAAAAASPSSDTDPDTDPEETDLHALAPPHQP